MSAAVRASARSSTDVPSSAGAGLESARARLERALAAIGPLAVAVSGGVDSITLAVLAHRLLPGVQMLHASSAAVPAEASARVAEWAAREGWRLQVIDAGEFANEQYRANPVNRCFHCKTQLYASIGSLTALPIVSGANVSDLGEYRPGLDAARDHGVRHPYVEARIDKPGVRALAAALGLGAIAELPASPCLSSRVETGIRIEPNTLRFVHAVEKLVGAELSPRTVRCRVRADGIVVELDDDRLAGLGDESAEILRARIAGHALAPRGAEVRFEAYRNGSAFLHG